MSSNQIPAIQSVREIRTLGGDCVLIRTSADIADEVVRYIEQYVISINPLSGNERKIVSKGTYGRYSRYEITQHQYAGGGHPGDGMYFEALEIKDPPDQRCGFILYSMKQLPLGHEHSFFAEFQSLEDLLQAFDVLLNNHEAFLKISSSLPGFIRSVQCGSLTPWFYAVGNQEIHRDFAIVPDWGNDPMYPPGKQFIISLPDGGTRIKTCMGGRMITVLHSQGEPRFVYHYVLWDDGTHWDGSGIPPIASKAQPWLTDAAKKRT